MFWKTDRLESWIEHSPPKREDDQRGHHTACDREADACRSATVRRVFLSRRYAGGEEGCVGVRENGLAVGCGGDWRSAPLPVITEGHNRNRERGNQDGEGS